MVGGTGNFDSNGGVRRVKAKRKAVFEDDYPRTVEAPDHGSASKRVAIYGVGHPSAVAASLSGHTRTKADLRSAGTPDRRNRQITPHPGV